MRLKRGNGAVSAGQDYVFTGRHNGLVTLNFLPRENIWYPTLAQGKLRRRTFYQTRHTFASNALAAGENPKWVADMLGHKTTEILFQVYERFIPNRTRRDGTALVSRMEEESAAKSGDQALVQYAPNMPITLGSDQNAMYYQQLIESWCRSRELNPDTLTGAGT